MRRKLYVARDTTGEVELEHTPHVLDTLTTFPHPMSWELIRMKTCRVEDELVRELTTLSNQLNTLSPTWVPSEKTRGEIQERREVLQTAIKHHRAKGQDGKLCPVFDLRRAAALSAGRQKSEGAARRD